MTICKSSCLARCLVVVAVSFVAVAVNAQRDSMTYVLAAGTANVLDTYLSPERYEGRELRYASSRTHRYKETAWQWKLAWMVEAAVTHNRADNVDEIGGEVGVQYAWLRRWKVGRVQISAGPSVESRVGFLYNTRNQNNPAQAQAALNFGPAFTAVIPLGTLFGKPLSMSYDGALPLFGIMFSPNYGQSYYEIFSRNDYDHNVVATTLFSAPSYQQALSLAWRMKSSWLLLGYAGDYRQAEVNNLKYKHVSHLITIGYSKLF